MHPQLPGKLQQQILSRAAPKSVGTSSAKDVPTELATFAAGCFWGVELAFQRLPGVLSTQVGYIAGHVEEPSYEHVCTGRTGHTEAVQVKFDPGTINYKELCGVFFELHDPTQLNRQGNDVGTQYRSGIYYHSPEQQADAEQVKSQAQANFKKPIVTEVVAAATFWAAEKYHQQYLAKGGQSAKKGATDPIRCYG